MLGLEELLVIQDGLRNIPQIVTMIKFVKSGGFWTKDELQKYAVEHNIRVCPLIEIAKFPDGHHMIHDGTHRSVSVYLGGRKYLRDDEYVIRNWLYEDYMEISFENNWVTPFDPRTHIRVCDIGEYKKTVIEIAKRDKTEALNYIQQNKQKYLRERNCHGLKDLILFCQTKSSWHEAVN